MSYIPLPPALHGFEYEIVYSKPSEDGFSVIQADAIECAGWIVAKRVETHHKGTPSLIRRAWMSKR